LILVDSSVWIDYFRGTATPQTDLLDYLLAREPLAIGDLMLTEVLQGFTSDADFRRAQRLLTRLDLVEIGGRAVALQAARHFRTLRAHGVTVRKTIDCLIATRCLVSRLTLLHCDKDFQPFVKYLGLRTIP